MSKKKDVAPEVVNRYEGEGGKFTSLDSEEGPGP